MRLWNLADGTEVFLPDDLLATGGLAFTPDGRLITVNTEGVVKVWIIRPADGRRRSVPTPGLPVTWWRSVPTADCWPSGARMARLRSSATNPLEEVRTLEAHMGEISGLAFGAGDERLASAGE